MSYEVGGIPSFDSIEPRDRINGLPRLTSKVPEFHNASVGITFDNEATHRPLMHETNISKKSVLFCSYHDGVRVGCTFISNEALDYIYKKHQDFLKDSNTTEHQSGVG